MRVEEELTAKNAENVKGDEKKTVRRFGKTNIQNKGPKLFDMEGVK